MRLIFTSVIPIWLIGLLFAIFTAYSIAVYRRQNPRNKWAGILWGCRISVGALLLLALLQPVIARIRNVKMRGRIPVIVDTSGSMSIADSYKGREGLLAAWQLKLFDPEIRCTAFENTRRDLTPLGERLKQINAKLQSLNITNGELEFTQMRKSLNNTAKELESIANSVADIRVNQHKEVSRFDYLAINDGKGSGTMALQNFHDASLKSDRLLEAAERNLRQSTGKIRELTTANDNNAAQKLVDQVVTSIRQLIIAKEGFHQELSELQNQADTLLLQAEKPAILEAIAELSATPRLKLAKRLLEEGGLSIAKLNHIGQPEVFTLEEPVYKLNSRKLFGEAKIKADIPATRIGSVAQKILSQYGDTPIAALVLITDGNNNAGKPLTELKQELQRRNIPLLAVGIGLPQPPPDIALGNVMAPGSAFLHDNVTINCSIQRHGFEQTPITVELSEEEGEEPLDTVNIPGDGQNPVEVELTFKPMRRGYQTYVITIPSHEGEVLEINNQEKVSIYVHGDPIKALLVDEFPRWESRYVNMMLKRDPRVEVTTLFGGSFANGQIPRSPDAFPPNRQTLFAYDLIIFGDVDPMRFSKEELTNLKEFVTLRGGTFIIMAGPHFTPLAYQHTPIADIMPIQITPVKITEQDEDEAELIDPLQSAMFQLEGPAEHENVIRLADSPEDNRRLWQNLPGPNWVRDRISPLPTARVLVRAGEDAELPVVVSAFQGLGKVMYLGTDSFWQWRRQAGFEYHHRLWRQFLLWGTTGRTTGSNQYVKLVTSQAHYTPGEKVEIHARIFGRDGRLLENATAAVKIIDAWGKTVRQIRLQSLPDASGQYQAFVHDLPRGFYQAMPVIPELKDVLEPFTYPFAIRDMPTTEYLNLALDEQGLRETADQYRHFPKAHEILASIPRVEKVETRRQDYEIWDSFYMLIAITALLGLEWQMRK